MQNGQFITHELEAIHNVFALLLFFNKVIDELVKTETAFKGSLALLVDLLEEIDELAFFFVQQFLEAEELG
jgi:hypothetical protein